jgi:hypothetical protein
MKKRKYAGHKFKFVDLREGQEAGGGLIVMFYSGAKGTTFSDDVD